MRSLRVEVFDDLYSLFHVVCGAIASFFWPVVILFFIYELIEFCVKKREGKENYVGDILEFSLGMVFGNSLIQFFLPLMNL